ncbi:fimbrial protein [Franconibacter pulveris 1160]|uniref:fimbrial protein n=1 Tax=Franconibacter pulveris TaxID=435910 RepID=UPI00068795ED|nr:fimbrial protein [Franconibacter pulveris]
MNTLTNNRLSLYAFTLLVAMSSSFTSAQATDNNLHFSGALVSEPCNLDPQNSDIVVDFGSIVEKYLYQNTRTKSEPFVVKLTDCDTNIGSKVTLTFKGTESTALPGLLAVTGAATGIAIGMESSEGSALPFNQPTPEYILSKGTNNFILGVYVQGEPSAISQQTIISGDFTATATFELAYP